MKIKKIVVTNFKGMKTFSTSLDGTVTILSARNGAGKTSLLSAIKALIVGRLGDADIAKGESSVKVSMEIEDGTEISMEKSMGKPVVNRINGKRTTRASVVPIILNAFGASEEAMRALTDVYSLENSENISKVIMSLLPLQVSLEKFYEFSEELLKRGLGVEERAFIEKFIEDKDKTMNFEDIAGVHRKVYDARTGVKRLVKEYKAKTAVPVPQVDGETQESLNKELLDIATREAAFKQNARDIENYNRQAAYRNSLIQKRAGLEAQLAGMPAAQTVPNLDDLKKNLQMMQTAESKLRNRISQYTARIDEKSRVLARIREGVCPITRGNCGADMSGAVDVCNKQIANDTASRDADNKRLEQVIQKEDELRAAIERAHNVVVLNERRRGVESAVAAIVIPEEPVPPASVVAEDFDTLRKGVMEKLNAISAYNAYIQNRDALERANREAACAETAVTLFAPEGVRSVVLQKVLKPLEVLANKKGKRLRPDFEVSFEAENGLTVFCTFDGKKLRVDELSSGEKLFVSTLLCYVINEIKDTNILVIDDAERLDKENFRNFVKMFVEDGNIDNIIVACAEHKETEDIAKELGVNYITL